MSGLETRQQAVVDYYQNRTIAQLYTNWHSLHYGLLDPSVDLTHLPADEAYRLHCGSIDQMSRAIADFVNPQPGTIVIDAGCGTGELFPFLTKKGATVFGLNITLWHIVQAQRRIQENMATIPHLQHAYPVPADYMSMPFPDNSVDHILFSQTLCHAPNQQAVLLEADRVVKKNGSIVVLDSMLTKSTSQLTKKEQEKIAIINDGYMLDVTSHTDLIARWTDLGYQVLSTDYTENVLPSLHYAAAGYKQAAFNGIEDKHRQATEVTKDLNNQGLMRFIMVRATHQ